MENNKTNKIKIAILDLNNGLVNQGMRCLKDLIASWELTVLNSIEITVFEIRQKCEIPNLDFDIYLSSGGPGTPLPEEDGNWASSYSNWIKSVEQWNDNALNKQKKYVFFICHSFQLACRYYKIGEINKRKSTAFGIFPCHIIHNNYNDPIFKNMPDPFYIVDSRDFQVIERHEIYTRRNKIKILALEKERPNIPLARAIMSIRFNEYFVGTQFHPEADERSISYYLQQDEKKQLIIKNHGLDKWHTMSRLIKEEDKIKYTNHHLIPNFLNHIPYIINC